MQFEFRSSVCVRDGALFNCGVACWLSTSTVSPGAWDDWRSAAEGTHSCFASSSLHDVQLGYPSLTPASHCTSLLLKAAAASTRPLSAPTAGGPRGQTYGRPNLRGTFLPPPPRPKKVCGGLFYNWVRPGGSRSEARDEVPGMGAAGQREVSAEPWPLAAAGQAGFCQQSQVLRSLPRSTDAAVPLLAPDDTSVPVAAGGRCGEGWSIRVRAEAMPVYTCLSPLLQGGQPQPPSPHTQPCLLLVVCSGWYINIIHDHLTNAMTFIFFWARDKSNLSAQIKKL